MRFNILMEDGGVYKNAIILSRKGLARNIRDVYNAFKYEKGITIVCNVAMNKKLSSSDIYAVEEVEEYFEKYKEVDIEKVEEIEEENTK